ncbi:MAG: hypothetical protein K9H61_07280, partial [Bacteroidia bacterium]|nr:hypothetical protein [Bacteroidia bacterium]
HLLKQGLVEKTLVQTENLDTLILSYKLNTKLNYADGEKYLLPVLPNGIEQNIITYYSLDKDTVFNFSTEAEGKYTLSLSNNYTQLIRDEIQRLKDYHYGCVEQTTSKLNALLVEKSLCKLLGDSFQNEELIKICIKRLEVMQQSNGAYGWFSRSGAEVWLTHYVLTTLFDARKMGYRSHAYSNGIAYLNKHNGEFNQSDKIKALQLLFAERIDVDYTGILSKIEETNLNFYDRLLITYVKQQMDLPHFSGFLFEGIQKDAEGGIYWNTPTLNIYQNRANAGLMAYEVLKRDQADSSILAGIRKYYFNEKTFGMGVYRNTLESAKVLQTMAKDIALSEKGTLFTRVKLNGKDLGTQFPMKLNLSNGTSYSVEKTGAKGRMFVNQKVFVEQPKQDTLLFKINSYFTQDNHQVDTLQTNYQINYVVNVYSLKNQEYVMVQIPIPATCNYLNKLNRFNADEIEYHKDRVILYFRKMRAGSYNFTFSLEPRFEGEFTLLPVQVENMYDPEVKGNNSSKQVRVGGK